MCKTDFVYFVDGEGADIVLLHGWGASKECWTNLVVDLSTNYRVWAIDLWGFGATPPPNSVVGVDEYAQGIQEFIEQKIARPVCVVGHSFGGRIAIVLANKCKYVQRLILIDSAGVPPRFSFKRFLKVTRYKRLKKLVTIGKRNKSVLDNYGSTDWKNADGVMRGILCRVVSQNLIPAASKITQPTLLLWGKLDKVTPLYMAKTLRKTIKNSRLAVVRGDHFCFLNKCILDYIYKFLENWE